MARKSIVTKDNTITSSSTEPLSREVARPIFGESVLAIDYNFADKDVLDSDITFSRSSGATQVGSDGYIKYAPHNLLKKSEDWNNSSWSMEGNANTDCEFVSTGHADPLGGNNGTILKALSTDPAPRQDGISVVAGQQYVFSIYMKGKGTTVGKNVRLQIWYGIGTATGTIVADTSNYLTDEWQRFEVVSTPTGSGTVAFRFDPPQSASVNEEVYVFGAMAEASFSGKASPYVKNDTTSPIYKERFEFHQVAHRMLLILIVIMMGLLTAENFTQASFKLMRLSIPIAFT